jgi:hypothetical protein
VEGETLEATSPGGQRLAQADESQDGRVTNLRREQALEGAAPEARWSFEVRFDSQCVPVLMSRRRPHSRGCERLCEGKRP